MAFTTPGTAVAGQVLTAAFLNTNVRDNTNFLYTPPMVRAARTTAQSIANGVVRAISFNSETFDTDGMFTATSTTLTIQTTGVYLVAGQISMVANATGARFVLIALNPTLTGSGDSVNISNETRIAATAVPASATTQTPVSISCAYSLTAGNTLALGIFQNSGGALNTDTTETTALTATWIGRVP